MKLLEANNNSLDSWLSLDYIQIAINDELECALQEKYDLALKEFLSYIFCLSQTKRNCAYNSWGKVGLSQSVVSRLANRMESKSWQRTRTWSHCRFDNYLNVTSIF